MTNPFPSSYEEPKKYYVYAHIDRRSNGGDIIYIGHGCGGRAWLSTVPFRDEAHADKLKEFEDRGETPDEWVKILKKRLTKQEACEYERSQIKLKKPAFNKIQGASLLKVTPELLEEAFQLREKGLSYSAIAEELALATMTIHRAMNGKSPALEEVLERRN